MARSRRRNVRRRIPLVKLQDPICTGIRQYGSNFGIAVLVHASGEPLRTEISHKQLDGFSSKWNLGNFRTLQIVEDQHEEQSE